MTPFTLVCSGVFVVLLCVGYGKDIYAYATTYAKKLLPTGGNAKPPAGVGDSANQTVRDLMMIAELRTRLAAVNSKEGVDACSFLLKTIIDQSAAPVAK